MPAGHEFPSWEPRELGLPRAMLIAILLVGVITAAGVWMSASFSPKPQSPAIQAMQVSLAQLPKPAPPAPPVSKPIPPPPPVPPQPAPPPKPVPVVIPKPPPVPSRVPVETRKLPPPPPVPHVSKPVPHPPHRRPPVRRPVTPPVPPAAPAAPRAAPTAAAPVVPTSGIPVYGERVYEIIQANQNVPEVLSEMGLSGRAVIEIVVAPNGKILSASVYKSSGVPIIDSTALEHARDAQLPPFNNRMPNQPHAFLVPIQIQAAND
ncbi:MAG TPA: TonB family protein [Acidocella sp.]|nr:TonB family protein [Acidocella sp.]